MAISDFDMVSTALHTLFTQSKVTHCGKELSLIIRYNVIEARNIRKPVFHNEWFMVFRYSGLVGMNSSAS